MPLIEQRLPLTEYEVFIFSYFIKDRYADIKKYMTETFRTNSTGGRHGAS